jgi:hypothetical protein
MSKNLSWIDLDEKINLIYNFNDDSIKSCHQIEPINLNNIKLEDIKVPSNNKYNEPILNDITNAKFQLIKFDNKSLVSVFKRYSEGFPININISPYKNKKEIDNMGSNNNKDSLFSYVLSQLVLEEKTQHILLPLINIDVDFYKIDDIFKSYPVHKEYINLLEENKISNIFSLRCKAQFTDSISLMDYLNSNKDKVNYKIILFQIIHTLAVIQKDYPDFIHNNLKLGNIFVETLKKEKLIKYIFENNIFEINSKISIKISSFEYSQSDKILKGSLSSKANKYTDLLLFLNNLYKHISFEYTNSETMEFLNRIFPKKLIGKYNSEELYKPSELLKDNYFRSLQPNLSEKKYSKQTYMKNILENQTNNNFLMNLESDSKSILGNQSLSENEESIFNNITDDSDIDITTSLSEKKYKRIEVNKKGSRKINQKGGDINISEKNFSNNIMTRQLKIEQKGGDLRNNTAPFKKEMNNPFVTNDARSTYSKRKEEEPKNTGPPLLAEQKVYDTTNNSKPPPSYIPTEVAAYNPFYAHSHPLYPYETKTNPVHVVKPVNISFANPVGGSHMTINRVYEDIIPGDRFTFSLRSTFERRQLTNYIRSMILENGDGEELSISTGKKKSLLSHIKLLEINPYNIGKNPYKSLSRGFLLYTSAYSIRYNQERDKLDIAKQAMGINVRIYELSFGAQNCFKINDRINMNSFDVWREIKYYEYIREDIIKRKVSPNFVSLYLYTVDSTSNIDYQKLSALKYQSDPKGQYHKELKNQDRINNLHELDPLEFLMLTSYGMDKKTTTDSKNLSQSYSSASVYKKAKETAKYLARYKYIESPGPTWTQRGIEFLGEKGYFRFVTDTANQPRVGKKATRQEVTVLSNIIGKQDLSTYTGSSLVALTESPNSNILKWASPLSDNFGTVQKMVETGYHSPDVWKSVLFQLVYACAVLQEKDIYFEKFSLENNIFIKDLFNNSEKRDHWVYKVDNYDFYVPNYGYLLMIDSRYVDVMDDNTSVYIDKSDKSDDEGPKYKIQSTTLYGDKSVDTSTLRDKIYDDFKNMINSDNFNNNLEKIGGEKPDESVLDLLRNIYNDTSSTKKILDLLKKHFVEFLNNRVGTLLTHEETNILPLIPRFDFKEGETIIYQERYQEYRWAIYVGKGDNNHIKIYVSDDERKIFTTKEVYGHTLFKFPEGETIKQNNVNGIRYDSNFTIETYKFNN